MTIQDKLSALSDGIDGLTRRVEALCSKRGRNDADSPFQSDEKMGQDVSNQAHEATYSANSPKSHRKAAKLHEKAADTHARILHKLGLSPQTVHHRDVQEMHRDAAQMHRQATEENFYKKHDPTGEHRKSNIEGTKYSADMAKKAAGGEDYEY